MADPGPRRATAIWRHQLALAAALISAGCQAQSPPAAVHPDFDFTADSLATLIAPLEPNDAARVLERPQVFLELIAQSLAGPPELLWLIDKQHSLPREYEPSDLVPLSAYSIRMNRENHRLRRVVLPDLLAMVEWGRASGHDLLISSTYRSFDQQQATYDYWVDRDGQQAADRYSARAGHSQHQLGTAIDLGSIRLEYGDSEHGKWVLANAWRFGFSLSYPDGLESLTGYTYEPWHFRYIGRVGTELEKEFFGGVQQRLLAFLNESRQHLLTAWRGVADG